MPGPNDTLPLPPAKLLRECFQYDPETGLLIWKRRPRRHFTSTRSWKMWNTRYASTLAGKITRFNSRLIGINGRLYSAHRIIWKLVTGKDPPKTVDHEDGQSNDWSNLRLATQREQIWNRGIYKNNTSGYRGVNLIRGKWRAQIHRRSLGYFPTAKEASVAYEAAARKLYGKFYRKPT